MEREQTEVFGTFLAVAGWSAAGLNVEVGFPPFCDIAEGFYSLCFCTRPSFSS